MYMYIYMKLKAHIAGKRTNTKLSAFFYCQYKFSKINFMILYVSLRKSRFYVCSSVNFFIYPVVEPLQQSWWITLLSPESFPCYPLLVIFLPTQVLQGQVTHPKSPWVYFFKKAFMGSWYGSADKGTGHQQLVLDPTNPHDRKRK